MIRFVKVTLFAICALDASSQAYAVVDIQYYKINPGGLYTYKPSPWVGIPGGQPSEHQLDFGIGGTLRIDLDRAAGTAVFKNLDLVLTGNEAVQADPPPWAPVTAERVEAYLSSLLFKNIPSVAIDDAYAPDFIPLHLTFHVNGPPLTLTGGYDGTFVDGAAQLFTLAARPIPEPSALALAASCVCGGLLLRRRQRTLRAA